MKQEHVSVGMKNNETVQWKAHVKCILRNVLTGEVTVKEYDNLVTTVGKTAIARRLGLIALKANEGAVTYGAVGLGTTSPAQSDIKLQAEYFRKVISVYDYDTAQAIITLFLNTSEANANLREFGLFGEDASGTVDSGTLFNHVSISINKTVSDTLTIETTINLV